MIMPIADYPFEGPHRSVKKIENSLGVFAVICEFVGTYYLLDVDQSDDVKKSNPKPRKKKVLAEIPPRSHQIRRHI